MSILLRSCALCMLSLSLLACHSQSPIDALDAAAQRLEENLTNKLKETLNKTNQTSQSMRI